MKLHVPHLVLTAALALTACLSDRDGVNTGNGLVAVSVAVPQGEAMALTVSQPLTAQPAGGDLEITDTFGNTLLLNRVAIVVREMELQLAEGATDCEASEDDCETLEMGPFAVDVPLDAAVDAVVTAEIPQGLYSEIELDIHVVGSDEPDFVATHPELEDISILATGLFNGAPFTFTSTLDEEQELEFATPLNVDRNGADVTLRVDLRRWFAISSDELLDPSTANSGQPNEGLVTENIRDSLEGFEDDDRNGEPDD